MHISFDGILVDMPPGRAFSSKISVHAKIAHRKLRPRASNHFNVEKIEFEQT